MITQLAFVAATLLASANIDSPLPPADSAVTSSAVPSDRFVRVFLVESFPTFIPPQARTSVAVIIQRPPKLGGLAVYFLESQVSDALVVRSLYMANNISKQTKWNDPIKVYSVPTENLNSTTAVKRNIGKQILQKAKSANRRHSDKHGTKYRELRVRLP